MNYKGVIRPLIGKNPMLFENMKFLMVTENLNYASTEIHSDLHRTVYLN